MGWLRTSCIDSARKKKSQGYTVLEDGCEFLIFAQGQQIPKKFEHLVPKDQSADEPRKGSDRADMIRDLLSKGKTKTEVIVLMMKEYPDVTKMSMSSQVYGIAGKMKV